MLESAAYAGADKHTSSSWTVLTGGQTEASVQPHRCRAVRRLSPAS